MKLIFPIFVMSVHAETSLDMGFAVLGFPLRVAPGWKSQRHPHFSSELVPVRKRGGIRKGVPLQKIPGPKSLFEHQGCHPRGTLQSPFYISRGAKSNVMVVAVLHTATCSNVACIVGEDRAR